MQLVDSAPEGKAITPSVPLLKTPLVHMLQVDDCVRSKRAPAVGLSSSSHAPPAGAAIVEIEFTYSSELLVEGRSPATDLLLVGRHQGQAPEIDGNVYINDGMAYPGELVTIEVTEAHDSDLGAR